MSESAGNHPSTLSGETLASELLGALPDPVLIVGADSRIIAANPRARQLLPGARDGSPLVFALRAPDVLRTVESVLAAEPRGMAEWHERSPVERVFEVHVAAISLNGGRAAVLELRDMTEARRLEQMRVDFVANVSHELRTPLTSLLGFVETLQGPARDDPAARDKFLAIMGDQARRMARLVDDLLSLSRIELNEHVRPQSPADLVSVVRQIAAMLEPLSKEAGAAVRIEAPPEAIIPGDADELSRLAENLIENAIKYGAQGQADPRIDITIRLSDNRALLSVRDNGPGIAAEHLPRLTERFYRVDAPASRARGGTGLGLAIVKHIVLRHRAQLTIDSAPGRGTEFRVEFPTG